MKRKFCIIQPGQIGDVIICLPIAKRLADQGHNVIWPLWSHIFPHFVQGNINYVTFIRADGVNWYNDVLTLCKNNQLQPIDLSFNQVGTWEGVNTNKYKQQTDLSFDEFKYKLADVDINEKWNLQIIRNTQRELDLFKIINNNSKYSVYQQRSSDHSCNCQLDVSSYSGQIIEIRPVTSCIFDWIYTLENADQLILVESCFTNLVDQLSIKNRKQILLLKHGYYSSPVLSGGPKGLPLLKNDWIKI